MMVKKSIEIDKKADVISIRMRLRAQIKKEKPGIYVSYCPALDVCSQGETVKKARDNIIEATKLLIESCFERGVLHKFLAKKRFKSGGYSSNICRSPSIKTDEFYFLADIPIAINY